MHKMKKIPPEKPVTLTNLDRVARPTTRDGTKEAPAPGLQQHAKWSKARAKTNRIVQVAVVGVAPKPAYVVQDQLQTLGADLSSSERRKSSIQRSQTAPTRLKQPHTQTENGQRDPAPPSAHRKNGATAIAIQPRSGQNTREKRSEHTTNTTNGLKKAYGEMLECADVEALCLRLGLTQKDMWRLRTEFTNEDTDNSDTITVSSFFYLIHEEKRALTACLLRLAGLSFSSATHLTFDEYVQCVVTFATFTELELLQFFFRVYCDHTAGGTRATGTRMAKAMAESDVLKFGEDLQLLRTAFSGNIKIATNNATVAMNGQATDGFLTFADFERFSRQHMVAIFPLLRIQRNVRLVGGMGRAFWAQKTADKLQVEKILAYMKKNHGLQPPLPLIDRFVRFWMQRSTAQIRVRELAKRLYSG